MNTITKPWEDEPNELMFIDEETGLECIICRTPNIGILCGYVVFPEGKELNVVMGDSWEVSNISVHGGITYANNHPEFDNKYLVGFDCGHAGDLIPNIAALRDNPYINLKPLMRKSNTYKDIEYVKVECKKLAKQLYDLRESKK